MGTRKRIVKAQKNGQLVEYCYYKIGSKPVNEYFRAKSAEYRRRAGISAAIHTPPLTDQDETMARKLYKEGISQHVIAAKLGTTRYRIQRALGLR